MKKTYAGIYIPAGLSSDRIASFLSFVYAGLHHPLFVGLFVCFFGLYFFLYYIHYVDLHYSPYFSHLLVSFPDPPPPKRRKEGPANIVHPHTMGLDSAKS